MAFNIKAAFQALSNPQRRGYGVQSTMAIPPGWDTQQYLAAYGQVGWLYGAVSLIATSVAEVEWTLKQNGKDVAASPLLDLIDRANPFQTRYELFLMLQTYRSLVGKAFIVLNYTGRTPTEMWLAPPQYMTIIPDKETYIKGYRYKDGATEIFFSPQEVIYIPSPNPLNPMDGMGVVKPIATDLQNEIYATRYTNKLFYNDAVPGFAIEIPEMYSKDQREEYQADWDARHKGWSNARKTAFLWGGAKINTITMTNRDMDFFNLRKLDRETILGAFHIPTSLMGLSEVGSRARAEADEYIFARRVVKPALQAIKEAFNEQLCPLFGNGYKLSFEDPVPDNKEYLDNTTRASFQVGLITREEARVELGYDPEPTPGETLVIPFSSTPTIVGQEYTEPAKSLKSPDDWRWRVYIEKTEAQERSFQKALRTYWNEQKQVVVANFERNPSLEGAVFGEEAANAAFVARFKPLIYQTVLSSWNDALREFGKGVTKQSFDLLSPQAMEWIATRSLALASMLNQTTRTRMREVMMAEFAKGSSMDTIAKAISIFYEAEYKERALLVARTEIITASNQGANSLYKAEGVKKVQWNTYPINSCDECLAIEGNIYPIDEGPRPALHPNCRCRITAYLD